MELLEADSFVLQSFDTATGLKFFLTADPESKHLDQVRRGSWSAPAGRLFVAAGDHPHYRHAGGGYVVSRSSQSKRRAQ